MAASEYYDTVMSNKSQLPTSVVLYMNTQYGVNQSCIPLLRKESIMVSLFIDVSINPFPNMQCPHAVVIQLIT